MKIAVIISRFNIHYVSTAAFLGWWVNGQIAFFDRYLVPILSTVEGVVKPPFGQSLLAVLRRPAA